MLGRPEREGEKEEVTCSSLGPYCISSFWFSLRQSHLPPPCSLPLRPSRGLACIKENSAVRCSTPGSKWRPAPLQTPDPDPQRLHGLISLQTDADCRTMQAHRWGRKTCVKELCISGSSHSPKEEKDAGQCVLRGEQRKESYVSSPSGQIGTWGTGGYSPSDPLSRLYSGGLQSNCSTWSLYGESAGEQGWEGQNGPFKDTTFFRKPSKLEKSCPLHITYLQRSLQKEKKKVLR